jgi:nucleotide-binding universal stress UspA family protein
LVIDTNADHDPERATMTSAEPSRNRIVVGVDGSSSSLAGLDWAGHQAELTGSVLHLVTAWNWPAAYGTAFVFTDDFSPATSATLILEAAEKAVHDVHPTVEIQTEIEQGHPSSVLVKASGGATMLVVGCRGHGEFAGMLLGSVSEYCVTNAHCPVLVLRGGK